MYKKYENLLFDIRKYNSTEPKIKLIDDEKFYKFKEPDSVLRARYKFLKIRSLIRPGQYAKYLKFEKDTKLTVLRVYPKNDRFIFFLHYVLKFGRRKIHKITGISERYIRNLISEIN